MDTLKAEKIINSLECGIVPMDCVEEFTGGRKRELESINALLADTEFGKSGLLFVHGDLGVGKTHILGLTQNAAFKRNFLASHVVLTSRECPLSSLKDVYLNIIKNICFTGQKHKSGFYSFLEAWLNFASERMRGDMGKRCKHGLTYQTCASGCVNELYAKYIPELWAASSDFRNVVKLYQWADLHGRMDLKGYLLRWLLGERLTRIDLRWLSKQMHGVKIDENIDEESIFLTLKNIAKVSRMMGFGGLVILLDEAERIPSISRVTDGYLNLIRIIMRSLDMPGVLFIYATTPQFYDDARRYLKMFESNDTKDLLQVVYKRIEDEKLKLEPLTAVELEGIAERIFEIYLVAMNRDDVTFTKEEWKRRSMKMKDICMEQQTMRDFIGKTLLHIKGIDRREGAATLG